MFKTNLLMYIIYTDTILLKLRIIFEIRLETFIIYYIVKLLTKNLCTLNKTFYVIKYF